MVLAHRSAYIFFSWWQNNVQTQLTGNECACLPSLAVHVWRSPGGYFSKQDSWPRSNCDNTGKGLQRRCQLSIPCCLWQPQRQNWEGHSLSHLMWCKLYFKVHLQRDFWNTDRSEMGLPAMRRLMWKTVVPPDAIDTLKHMDVAV